MKPNILYILTDDLGYGDISCYGSQHFTTPNLDNLAKSGVRFTDAHAPSAVCTPTRYGILTGRYCFRSRLKKGVLLGHSEPLIERDRLTVAGLLKSNDYSTYAVGKWHLGLDFGKNGDQYDYSLPISGGPVDHGFDYFYGISASLDMPPYCFIENDRVVKLPSVPKEPLDPSQSSRGGLMSPGWKDEAVNGVLTNKALEMIENHSEQHNEQPFFMYLALTGPHTPWIPSNEFKGKSGIGPRGDLIMEIDWTVGEIMKKLELLNMRENTLIIFTSDNGPHPLQEEVTIHEHKPAGELRGQKSDIWDGGQRVPYLASWPKRIPPEGSCNHLICLTDLMATCASILGKKLPDHAGEDSFDNLPALLHNEPVRDSVVLHSLHGMFALRKRQWKYIEGQGSGGFVKKQPNRIGLPPEDVKEDGSSFQLYNMDEDLSEQTNRILDHPDVAALLAQELQQIVESDRSR